MAQVFNKRTVGDLTRLLIFMVTTALATSLLVITIGNISFASTKEVKAVFTDATGLVKGDDIRIAGVRVGSVRGIEVQEGEDGDKPTALVTFTVEEDIELDTRTTARIKYKNLVGQRFIEVSNPGGGEALKDDTIAVGRTKPALDLSYLFNGFKPLFEALSPDDINRLSYEIVQVFQGEGGTLESLLGSTASVTQTLADRDQVIGELLTNLDYVLDHIADRDDELYDLIGSFRNLVGGLKEDRQAILASLDGISELALETAGLVDDIREPFVRDIRWLRRAAGYLDRGRAELDRALQVMPIKLTKMGRTATYGSWFNFYLCHFTATVRFDDQILASPTYAVGADRCTLP